ncbi:MAG: histidine phosphatase family protein [Planctomycetes bacterium]|nr:histidine phosphatase family protein [Planctomycetota bacterium]
MKRWFVLVLAVLALFGALRAQDPTLPAAPARGSTVILVRHAEKDPKGDARDPGLSEEGLARAQALARLLAPAQPSHLYASEYHRTQATLEPLAHALGLEVEVEPAGKPAELLRKLRAQPEGSVSVVAGHSNSVPALVEALGGKLERLEKGQLAESEYGRLFVLTLPPAAASGASATTTLELAYGN